MKFIIYATPIFLARYFFDQRGPVPKFINLIKTNACQRIFRESRVLHSHSKRDKVGMQSTPEEVEDLFFLIRVKILALKASVHNIGRELDQLVIRSEALENMNRPSMQRRLRQAFSTEDYAVPADAAPRVARRAIYLPLDEAGIWRTALVRTLEIMAYG